ncbi:MAG: tRNA 2-thiouridine(34) synthase MnmA [Gammaproteobacteria bacterium]|nr:tRNA 2-thiouridine(34) synthase MnmA [Gammaproteobacteria bacterium]MCH9744168.1 tRNA 2-thiouridine(34) synthase MnmA [Gammaproteobacteria bacterium]
MKTKINGKKVVVGLSGGVDSAVAALLLKQQGHDVSGIFMQNWQADNDDPHCTAEQDLSDARAVCDKLGIPFHTINFSKQYWDNVFQYCLDEFNAGRTPNPDIWCNKEIKFKVFLEHALSLDADYLATGHYVRKAENKGHFQLLKGLDPIKDQSYFLYTLGQHELKHALFPLGALEKKQVREIAEQAGLHNHNKKDSTGICFIGERNFKAFLSEYLLSQPGDILTPEGKHIGQHDGLMFYTLGQRKGLEIGGRQGYDQSPWYVVAKNIEKNQLIVAQDHQHPLLMNTELYFTQADWVSGQPPALPFKGHAKTRYHQDFHACTLSESDNGCYHVVFEQPQRAITPGQSVVLYDKDICLGGGIIQGDSEPSL